MFIALLLVPLYAIFSYGGFGEIAQNVVQQDPQLFQFLSGKTDIVEIIVLVSGGLGIGFMYQMCIRDRIVPACLIVVDMMIKIDTKAIRFLNRNVTKDCYTKSVKRR